MASTYLDKTLSTPTNNKIYTFSAWVKRSGTGYNVMLNAGSSRDCFRFRGDNDRLHFFTNEATTGGLATNRVFRDKNAFYHLVLAVDTTQATASDRVKIYVNGVQETSFAVTNYPAQNYTNVINSAVNHRIGKASNIYNEYFDGIMSHVHFIDGTAYDASAFGETDANGVWTIKASANVTYGTNGFFILKDSGSVTDQSGNGNNFTVSGGTLTDTLDCPDNVFATLNPLSNSGGTFSNGNNSRNGGDDTASTLGVSAGKWYWEVKRTNSTNSFHTGICSTNKGMNGTGNQFLNGETNAIGGSIYVNESGLGNVSYSSNAGFSSVSYNSFGTVSISSGDILGFALDLDSATKRLDVYQNGSSIGNMTFSYDELNPIFVYCRMNTGVTADFNFGNGYFGTTAVASAGTNASGNGIFEYDVPTGYTALCTKGLNGE